MFFLGGGFGGGVQHCVLFLCLFIHTLDELNLIFNLENKVVVLVARVARSVMIGRGNTYSLV